MWNNYHIAASLDEAKSLLSRYGASARVVAGGTDILIELERGLRPGVDTLIDISRIPELHRIEIVDGNIEIGALITHNDLVENRLIYDYALPLAQAAWTVGAPQIRNRGTLAGNVITASPANDTITPLIALGASVVLESVRERRIVPLEQFYTGVRRTVMQPDELVTSITIPQMKADQRGVFLKLGLRRAQAISVVNVAVVLTFAPNSIIEKASITLGCVAPTIIHAAQAENYLVGKSVLTVDELFDTASSLAASEPKPIDDIRSTAEYRTAMIKTLVKRALHEVHVPLMHLLPHDPAMLRSSATPPQAESRTFAHDDVLQTRINGKQYMLHGTHKTLLRLLREDANLIGTKEGCAEGECGSCTVFLDGAAVMACMVPAPRAHGAEIVTVEGLAQNGELHPIQSAFMETGAVQCGYCTPGFIMSGAKLLEEHPNPTREQIEQSITGNLCRCTGYYKIIEAFEKASAAKETL
jgi:xanthine dehydrogenase iron-sulfur cluster and FAD-binding subunit A